MEIIALFVNQKRRISMVNPFFCLVCGKKIAEDMYISAQFCDNTCRWKYFIIKQKNSSYKQLKAFVDTNKNTIEENTIFPKI